MVELERRQCESSQVMAADETPVTPPTMLQPRENAPKQVKYGRSLARATDSNQ